MEISTERYQVNYDPAKLTLACQGSLRLYGEEYSSIVRLFREVADEKSVTITLNLKELQFLNSSGINAVLKFVIWVRDRKTSQLVVQGTHQFPWQSKVLYNIQQLMPRAILTLD